MLRIMRRNSPYYNCTGDTGAASQITSLRSYDMDAADHSQTGCVCARRRTEIPSSLPVVSRYLDCELNQYKKSGELEPLH